MATMSSSSPRSPFAFATSQATPSPKNAGSTETPTRSSTKSRSRLARAFRLGFLKSAPRDAAKVPEASSGDMQVVDDVIDDPDAHGVAQGSPARTGGELSEIEVIADASDADNPLPSPAAPTGAEEDVYVSILSEESKTLAETRKKYELAKMTDVQLRQMQVLDKNQPGHFCSLIYCS